jgi:hypothetical protein
MAGADDPIIPVVNAEVMVRLIPHAHLHVYPDGHLGLLTRADELAPRVAAFLDDPSPRFASVSTPSTAGHGRTSRSVTVRRAEGEAEG